MAATISKATPRFHPLDQLWRLLRRDAMLIAPALILLALALLALALPQLPGQLRNDPVASARWLKNAVEHSQPFGSLLRTLGLFDFLHSPLVAFVGVLLLLVALVHLADAVSEAARYRRLSTAVSTPEADGEPLDLPTAAPLFQRRGVAEIAPDEGAERAEQAVRDIGMHLLTPHTTADVQSASLDGIKGEVTLTSARHILATRNAGYTWVRILLPAGLLVILLALWLTARLGWSVHVEAMALGEVVSFPLLEVTVDWSQPDLLVAGTASGQISLAPEAGRARGADAGVTVRRGAPSLVITTDEALLSRPGDESPSDLIGVVLPQPGSEEIVLLPQQGAGLRLVRLPANEPSFLVEYYNADEELPYSRVTISGTAAATLSTPVDGLAVQVSPTWGLDVLIRRAPWLWLLIPGAVMVATGTLSLWRRPALCKAQMEPWPPVSANATQTLVTLQASAMNDLKALATATHLEELPPAPESPAAP